MPFSRPASPSFVPSACFSQQRRATMRERLGIRRCAISLALGLLLASLARAGTPTAATQALLADYDDLRAMYQGEQLIALFGEPFAQAGANESSEDFLDDWLNTTFPSTSINQADALGVDNVLLALRDCVVIAEGTKEVCTYTQEYDPDANPNTSNNIPIHETMVKLVTLLDEYGDADSLIYAGVRLVDPSGGAAAPDECDTAGAAITVQSTAYSGLTYPVSPTAEQVLYRADDGTLYRAWRFVRHDDDDEAYRFFVDSDTCAIVGMENMIDRLTNEVSGNASGYVTPCNGPSDCASDSTPALLDLANLRVRLIQQDPVSCANDNGTLIEELYADENGDFTFSFSESLPVKVVGDLVSPWVIVETLEGTNLRDCAPVESLPASPVPDLVFNEPTYTEYAQAQVNAFHSITYLHNWLKDLQPNLTAIDFQATSQVNSFPCDIKAFIPEDRIRMGIGGTTPCRSTVPCSNPNACGYCEGEDCDNCMCESSCECAECDCPCNNQSFHTAYGHEFTHINQEKLGLRTNGPFREGTADLMAAMVFGTHKIAENLCTDGHVTSNIDPYIPEDASGCGFDPCEEEGGCECQVQYVTPAGNPDEVVDGCTLPPACPQTCGEDEYGNNRHCQGLVISGAFWDMRKALIAEYGSNDGIEKANRIFADFYVITDGVLDDSIYVEALIADDTDGFITYSGGVPTTPNGTEIFEAFVTQHGWPGDLGMDDGTVKVEWDGPSASPQAGMDYDVYYQVIPPNVVLTTTEVVEIINEVQVNVGVTAWDIGCIRNSVPCNLGSITADWSDDEDGPYNVTIRIGVDTVNTPCKGVNVVDVVPQTSTTYVNIQFAVEHVMTRATAYANDATPADGGAVYGTISLFAEKLIAHVAGFTGQDMILGQDLNAATIDTVAPGQKIVVGRYLIGVLRVTGDLPATSKLDIDEIRFIPQPGTPHHGRLWLDGAGATEGVIDIGELSGANITIDPQREIEGSFEVGQMSIGPPNSDGETTSPSINIGDLSNTLEIEGGPSMVGEIHVGSATASANIKDNGRIDIVPAMAPGALLHIHGNVVETTSGPKIRLFNGISEDAAVAVDGEVQGDFRIGNAAQEIEATVAGTIDIGADLRGTIVHYGTVSSPGTNPGLIYVGGDIISGGGYEQTRDPASASNWTGTIWVAGDLLGSIEVYGPLQDALVEIDGNLGGTLDVREMYGSSIAANYSAGDTSGYIKVGRDETVWNDDSGDVLLDQIDVFGNLTTTGRLQFKGCFNPDDGTYNVGCYTIHGSLSGAVIDNSCGTATVTLQTCPYP